MDGPGPAGDIPYQTKWARRRATSTSFAGVPLLLFRKLWVRLFAGADPE